MGIKHYWSHSKFPLDNGCGCDCQAFGMKYRVTKKAKRPASGKDECFYCNEPVGEYHKSDCVLVNRDVEIEMRIRYKVKEPSHWDKEQIEFYRNEGSWCASNVLEELQELDKEKGCLCRTDIKFTYIKDLSGSYLDEK